MTDLIERTGRTSWFRQLLSRCFRVPLGPWGEWVALGHLLRLGWEIVMRNWRSGRGEVDLIAYDGPYLVFVEVKTRKVPSPVPPEESVDHQKREQLESLSFQFQARYEIDTTPVRFDLVAIETADQRHYRLRHYVGFM